MSTQVFRIFIKSTPQEVWDAITDSKWNSRYGYCAVTEYDLTPGGEYKVFATAEMQAHGAPELMIDGEVLESDPPRKLVQTWRAMFSPETTAEGFTRLTWEIEEVYQLTRLTLTHELDGAPIVASHVTGDALEAGGGWPMILSDLKTLLETGTPFQG